MQLEIKLVPPPQEKINAQQFSNAILNLQPQTEVCTIISDHYEEILPPEGKYFSKVIKLPNYLCFTAEEAGSTIGLFSKNSTATLQYSRNGIDNWTEFNTTDTITLDNVGDKVYFKGSETSASMSDFTRFSITGTIAASGSIMSILTYDYSTNTWDDTTIPCDYACYAMFNYSGKIITPMTTTPSLPATTLTNGCYYYMFRGCEPLTMLPKLPALTLTKQCYQEMFAETGQILSKTQDNDFPNEYRIPITGTGTTADKSLYGMFVTIRGTVTRTPTINTTYYTSKRVV